MSSLIQNDGLLNVVSGLGTEKSKRMHNRWQYESFTDWASLDACYATNWIARQIVDVPAQDMTREWRRIKSEWAEEISRVEDDLNLPVMVRDAASWARLYGGGAILMVTGQDFTKPLRPNRVRKGDLTRLIVFDRWELSPLTYNTWDILAPNYLQPEFYTVQGGQQQIHYTHFARFMGERLPRRQMTQTQGWGDSVLRKCLSDISDMVAAKDGIAELMQEANIDVIKREGLAEALASGEDDAITQRYSAYSQMKSIVQMALLDGDETFERQTLNLSGVAPIIEQFMVWISGASRIPLTKLFGTSAKGLNATGEGDLRTYYDDIRAMQQDGLARPLRDIDEVLVRSAVGDWPDDFSYEWNPLSQPNAVEDAQADLMRAQAHDLYMSLGVVQRSQVMRELQSSETYQYSDGEIDELESLEDGNMFDEPPESAVTDGRFIERYRSLQDGGLAHDQIMKHLS